MQSEQPSKSFAASLATITLIGPMAIHLYLPAMPVVKEAFGVTDALAGLAFSSALITMAIATLAYGSAADNIGRRPALLTGLGLFLAGSVLCAIASDIWLLVAGRVVQAAGAGCSLTLVRTIARDAYGQEHLVRAIAYLTMFYTMGPIFAPLLGGILIDHYGWRSIFAFAVITGLVVLISTVLFVPETRPDRPAKAAGEHWITAYRDLFAVPRFDLFILQTGCNSSAFMVTATAASFIMQDNLGRAATEFGLYFAMIPTGFLIGSAISSRLSGRVRIETMVLAGATLLTSAVVVQAILLLSGVIHPLTLALPGMFITMGNGLSMPSAQAGAMATVPRHAGTAAGIGVFVQMLMTGVVTQIYGVFSNGTVYPLVVIAGVCAAGAMITGLLIFGMRRG
jgi:DHA1 family bicyclomycin/chloramphenicol resistance-like MFS transporter